MTAASELLEQFEAIGATIETRDGRLVLRSEHPIPQPMIAAAKLARDELIQVIAHRDSGIVADPVHKPSASAPTFGATCTKSSAGPLCMRDGRTLWRLRAQAIPRILNDEDIRPAVEARWYGCTLVADGLELIVVVPCGSVLPEHVLQGLAANAGTIIALLRGESRVRTKGARAAERQPR